MVAVTWNGKGADSLTDKFYVWQKQLLKIFLYTPEYTLHTYLSSALRIHVPYAKTFLVRINGHTLPPVTAPVEPKTGEAGKFLSNPVEFCES